MKELTIELTSKCQLHCLWCSSAYDSDYELKYKDVVKILDECKSNGFTHVRFSGGEPTLYKDLNLCITHAKNLGYHITLLTNGVQPYYNYKIDKFEIQWLGYPYSENILSLKNLTKKDNISINVVNVREANVDEAVKFCGINNIPLHIMKLQLSNAALINKSKFTIIDISTTGDKGCSINNKQLIQPTGKIIKCASDKSNNKCIYGVCSQ